MQQERHHMPAQARHRKTKCSATLDLVHSGTAVLTPHVWAIGKVGAFKKEKNLLKSFLCLLYETVDELFLEQVLGTRCSLEYAIYCLSQSKERCLALL